MNRIIYGNTLKQKLHWIGLFKTYQGYRNVFITNFIVETRFLCKGENSQLEYYLINLLSSDVLPISKSKDQIKQLNLRACKLNSLTCNVNWKFLENSVKKTLQSLRKNRSPVKQLPLSPSHFLECWSTNKIYYPYGRRLVELVRPSEPQYVGII